MNCEEIYCKTEYEIGKKPYRMLGDRNIYKSWREKKRKKKWDWSRLNPQTPFQFLRRTWKQAGIVMLI